MLNICFFNNNMYQYLYEITFLFKYFSQKCPKFPVNFVLISNGPNLYDIFYIYIDIYVLKIENILITFVISQLFQLVQQACTSCIWWWNSVQVVTCTSYLVQVATCTNCLYKLQLVQAFCKSCNLYNISTSTKHIHR